MGLDHWLYVSKFLSDWREDEDTTYIKRKIKQIFPRVDFPVMNIKFKVITWRKFHPLHKWFVDFVQHGEDDCSEYDVSWEQLEELYNIVSDEKLMEDAFDWEGDLDKEYYLEEARRTKEILKKIFDNPSKYSDLDFTYSSSW